MAEELDPKHLADEIVEPSSSVEESEVLAEPIAETETALAEVEAAPALVAEESPEPKDEEESEHESVAESEEKPEAATKADEEPKAAEAKPVAETKPKEAPAPAETGGHPLKKIKEAENSCIKIKGKLVPEAGKQYRYVIGQKATVTVKGYPVHIYGYAGLIENGKMEVLPIFLHVGDGDAPWRYIIKELAEFGLFGGFIIQDYSDEIRKGLAAVSLSTRHFSSVNTPAATHPILTRANYDFSSAFKRVWQNTGGRVEDCAELEKLSSMCVDSLADFFKSKTYPM